MKAYVWPAALTILITACATTSEKSLSADTTCGSADILVASSDRKSLVVLGVSHEQGNNPLQRCLIQAVKKWNPEVLILHAVGPKDRLRRRIESLPQKMWEEQDFLFQWADKNGLEVSLTDPSELDLARIERWRTDQFQGAVIKNLVFEIMKNTWEKRRRLGYFCDKSCLLRENLEQFLAQRSWFEGQGIWNWIVSELHLLGRPKEQGLAMLVSQLNSYAQSNHQSTFLNLLEAENLYDDRQPFAVAPYPLGLGDINKLAAIEHNAVNQSEMERIEDALQKSNRVFAQTGRAHLKEYGQNLLKRLEFKFGMQGKVSVH